MMLDAYWIESQFPKTAKVAKPFCQQKEVIYEVYLGKIYYYRYFGDAGVLFPH